MSLISESDSLAPGLISSINGDTDASAELVILVDAHGFMAGATPSGVVRVLSARNMEHAEAMRLQFDPEEKREWTFRPITYVTALEIAWAWREYGVVGVTVWSPNESDKCVDLPSEEEAAQ